MSWATGSALFLPLSRARLTGGMALLANTHVIIELLLGTEGHLLLPQTGAVRQREALLTEVTVVVLRPSAGAARRMARLTLLALGVQEGAFFTLVHTHTVFLFVKEVHSPILLDKDVSDFVVEVLFIVLEF